ncbi:hypothetical protein ACL02T_12645 [Pseudonocardia sp. RS010]|uniref:hypothetical protein n=1 Tax=Pseudonocardia sp. RS010 TaxID=3385979 RepID=UPI0039A233B4
MADLGGLRGTAIALVQHYHSTPHLFAAEHFARLAKDFEDTHADKAQRIYLQHRAYVMGSIMEAVAFLESYINEIYQCAQDGKGSAISGLSESVVTRLGLLWPQLERSPILDKYAAARAIGDLAPVDRGRRPHDDVTYLLKLRNWLVHNKPRAVGEGSPHKIIDHVRGRFAENPLLPEMGKDSWFPDKALSAGCAEWAVESARSFVEKFIDDLGGTRSHHRLIHDEQA